MSLGFIRIPRKKKVNISFIFPRKLIHQRKCLKHSKRTRISDRYAHMLVLATTLHNARLGLANSYNSCDMSSLQSGDDTSKALEETKSLTAQSLASIAYQINTLATSVLNLLDAQSQQLGHMESAINLIGQVRLLCPLFPTRTAANHNSLEPYLQEFRLVCVFLL